MKKLLKVSAMTGLLTLLRMLMGFIVAKIVAIHTGPTGLAMLGQVQSMVATLNGVINAPVGSGVVRYTAENHYKNYDSCAPWWRASLYWVMIITFLTLPFTIFFSSPISLWLLHDIKLTWLVILTASILPLTALGTLCNSIINGQQLYRRFVGLGMISTIISSAVMITLIITANIKGALFAVAIQSSLIGLIMLVANLRQPWFKLHYFWGKIEKSAKKAILGYMVMALTSAVTVPVSLILIRNILISQVGWDATGYWQAVWKISEVYLGVITMALGTYYLPKLASLTKPNEIIDEIKKTAYIIIPIVILLSLCVYLMRDIIIWLLFTEEFKPARDLFSIQLIGDVIKITGWLYAYPMLSRGTVKWFVSTEIFFSSSFVILSYIFISLIGVEGVTWAYLINYTLYLTLLFFGIKKIIR